MKLKLPVAVGVPAMTPADVKVSPGGSMSCTSDEGVIVKVWGSEPPTEVKRWEYGVPTVAFRIPDSRLMADTFSVNVRRNCVPAESVTIRSNEYCPAVLGTPARTVTPGVSDERRLAPDSRFRPGGSVDPGARAHVYG